MPEVGSSGCKCEEVFRPTPTQLRVVGHPLPLPKYTPCSMAPSVQGKRPRMTWHLWSKSLVPSCQANSHHSWNRVSLSVNFHPTKRPKENDCPWFCGQIHENESLFVSLAPSQIMTCWFHTGFFVTRSFVVSFVWFHNSQIFWHLFVIFTLPAIRRCDANQHGLPRNVWRQGHILELLQALEFLDVTSFVLRNSEGIKKLQTNVNWPASTSWHLTKPFCAQISSVQFKVHDESASEEKFLLSPLTNKSVPGRSLESKVLGMSRPSHTSKSTLSTGQMGRCKFGTPVFVEATREQQNVLLLWQKILQTISLHSLRKPDLFSARE